MPKTLPSQRKTIGRGMHEFEHEDLKSGPGARAAKFAAAVRQSPLP